jgi:hypothetical protein
MNLKNSHMKKIIPFLFLSIMAASAGCKKDKAPTENTVTGTASLTTDEASFVTFTSALLGGTLTNPGTCPVDSRGIAIGTMHDPTISETFYPEVPLTESGSFSIPAGSLMPGTTYYVRAYAVNCKGISYGNEIHFTTSGGGSSDTAYFKLTIGGATYFSYDLQDALHSGAVFPEGDTRFAIATWDTSNQVFMVASQSSFILDPAKIFGYSFSYINPEVNAPGTYSFGKFVAANKTIVIAIRTSTGDPLAWTNPGYNSYENSGNFTRHPVTGNCEEVELTSAVNTLVISRWGNPGQLIEGTIDGTVYENIKGVFNCQNSITMPFTVEFRLKRLQ